MDWQSVIVVVLVLAALAFVARRGWTRLQSVVGTKVSVRSSCASACGACDGHKRVLDQSGAASNIPSGAGIRVPHRAIL
jgi:hypothetical protein